MTELLASQNFGGSEAHDADAIGNHVSLNNIARHNVDAGRVPPFIAKITDFVIAPVSGLAAVGVGLKAGFHTPNLAGLVGASK